MQDNLSVVKIGNTNVSVQELIDALCDVLDAHNEYDIQDITGLSEERCLEIHNIRESVKPYWDLYEVCCLDG